MRLRRQRRIHRSDPAFQSRQGKRRPQKREVFALGVMRHWLCVVCLAASALAAATPPPNIILITLDTTRADRMGFLGSKRGLTPNLDALAQQSAVFSRAYAQAPLTSPSHATILTGTYPQFHQVFDFPDVLAKDLPYAPDLLHGRGYTTAAFLGSIALDPNGGAPGFERGFDVYDAGFTSLGFQKEEDRYHTVERRGGEVVERAIRWLGQNPKRPFFLWVHLYDPHEPYDPPEPYKTRYAAEPYDGEIAYMDSAVGRLFQELKTRGLYDSAMIAVMADHGESLGAHGENNHGFFLYDETIHVPLVIKLPLASAAENQGEKTTPKQIGSQIDDRVELIDVMPTLLQTAGITVPAEVQGQSLLGLMSGSQRTGTVEAWRDRPAYAQADYPHIAFGWSALQSLRTGKYLYVQAPRRELYDQSADPEAEHNLASSSAAVADTLGGQVQSLREKTSSKREAPKLSDDKVAALDVGAQAKLASLGYVTSGSHAFQSSDSGSDRSSGQADPKDKIETIHLIRRLNDLLDDRHLQESIPILQKLITENPDMPMPYYRLGGIYADEKDYDKALPMLRKAVAMDPKFAQAELALGRTLMRTGDLNEATGVFEKLTASAPYMADAHVMLEIVYARTNRVPETISECEKVLKLLPDHFGSYLTLGQFLAKSGDLEAAVPNLQKAVELRPRLPAPHMFLADVYALMGRQADADRERAEGRRLAATPPYPANTAPNAVSPIAPQQ
jgi:arylsulfatase A-like enzyme/cytochrome c-type biogenesis protein CcmH/NrfG